MRAQLFDVFSGEPNRNPKWIGTERDSEKAKERMERLATENPGKYFVWYSPARQVIAVVDTDRSIRS